MAMLLRCCGFLLLTFVPLEPAAAQSVDWPTYGFEPGRSSFNPNEVILTPQSVSQLQLQWSANMGSPINSQPVVVQNALVSGVPTALVYIGATNGTFAAFNAATGALVWSRQLGTLQNGCGQEPNGIYGISGTPVHDPARQRIYVADAQGLLYALDDATGQTARGWPIQVIPDPTHEFVWGALSLVNGRILVENASYCDIAPYGGFVFSIDPATRTIVDTFAVTQNGDGGGIWGWGGAAVDPTTRAIYVATGNGLSSETSGYSEDVVRLDRSLKVVSANYAGLVGGDVDYGATPFLYSTPCNNQVAAVNKSGVLVTYDRDNIDAGPLQKLQISDGGGSLIGDLAEDPTVGYLFVANPDNSPSGPYNHGLLAFQINGACQLQLAWQTPIGTNGMGPLSSPTAIPGVVFAATGEGNTLYALNSSTGAELWSSSVFQGPVFVAPAVVGGQVYIGSWDSNLYAFGLPQDFALTVIKIGAGAVKSAPAGIDCGATCSASFASGTEVRLHAIPASGWTFREWRGACTGRNEHDCYVTMSAAASVIATFGEQ
jgi:outer membrane protein assembly factor BamB